MNFQFWEFVEAAIIKCSTWGTLIQHIPDEIQSSINHEQENPRDQPSHIVKIKKSSNLYKITKI